MNNIRKFYLRNRLGQVYDMQSHDHLAVSPDNLGVSLSYGRSSANGYHYSLSSQSEMVSPSFTMIFAGVNAYVNFNEFTQFLSFAPIQLRYVTKAFDYLADVDVVSISKGEINTDGYLESTLTLARTSPWFVEKEVLVGARYWPYPTGKIYHSEDGKFWGNKYSYVYSPNIEIPTKPYQEFEIPAAFSDPSNNGFGTKLKVISNVDGYTNPHIRLTNKQLNSKEYVQNEKFILTLDKGESIEVSSYQQRMYAVKYDANGISQGSIINLQDWTYEGFIKVLPGHNTVELVPVTTEAKLVMTYREEAVIA